MSSSKRTSIAIDGHTLMIFTHNDFKRKEVIATGTFEELKETIRTGTFQFVAAEAGDIEGQATATKVLKLIEENKNASTK